MSEWSDAMARQAVLYRNLGMTMGEAHAALDRLAQMLDHELLGIPDEDGWIPMRRYT